MVGIRRSTSLLLRMKTITIFGDLANTRAPARSALLAARCAGRRLAVAQACERFASSSQCDADSLYHVPCRRAEKRRDFYGRQLLKIVKPQQFAVVRTKRGEHRLDQHGSLDPIRCGIIDQVIDLDKRRAFDVFSSDAPSPKRATAVAHGRDKPCPWIPDFRVSREVREHRLLNEQLRIVGRNIELAERHVEKKPAVLQVEHLGVWLWRCAPPREGIGWCH